MLNKIISVLIYLALLPFYLVYSLFTNSQGKWY